MVKYILSRVEVATDSHIQLDIIFACKQRWHITKRKVTRILEQHSNDERSVIMMRAWFFHQLSTAIVTVARV